MVWEKIAHNKTGMARNPQNKTEYSKGRIL
jgi:hypothetical protein